MSDEQNKKWYGPVLVWLPNIYYVATILSLTFILAQVFFAKRSIVENGEWEKAKITMENIETFNEGLRGFPLTTSEVLRHADGPCPDFSDRKYDMELHTLGKVLFSIYDDRTDSLYRIVSEYKKDLDEGIGEGDFQERKKAVEEFWKDVLFSSEDEILRMLDVMNSFAYPIIMGYASETISYQNAARQFITYGNFIMPYAFHYYSNIAPHAKLLYRLWRIKFEILVLDNCMALSDYDTLSKLNEDGKLLFYEGDDVTEVTMKKYRKDLDKKLKDMYKEIEAFRKMSLK